MVQIWYYSALSLFAFLGVGNGATFDQHDTPDVVGIFHTEAFEQIADKYSTKAPESGVQLIDDITSILLSMCPEGDAKCNLLSYTTAVDYFSGRKSHASFNISYPDDFDEILIDAVEKMSETVRTIDRHNLDEVVDSLDDLRTEVEDVDGTNDAYKFAVLSGISVAKESALLWHSVFYDTEHKLHHVTRNNYRRNLQINIVTIVGSTVLGDCIGGITGVLDQILASPASVLTPATLIPGAVIGSVVSSLQGFFSGLGF